MPKIKPKKTVLKTDPAYRDTPINRIFPLWGNKPGAWSSSKELSYLLGVDIYATTTGMTAFMAGLGLGSVSGCPFLYRPARL